MVLGVRPQSLSPEDRAQFGARVVALRRNAGFTQADVAAAVGTSTTTITRIERGGRTPSLSLAALLAEHLGTTVDYLLTGIQPCSGARS